MVQRCSPTPDPAPPEWEVKRIQDSPCKKAFKYRLYPPEETSKGPVYPLHHILQNLGMDTFVLRKLAPYLGKIPHLLTGADGLLGFPIGIPPLL